MFQELHHLDFVVEKFAKELLRNVIFWDNFDSNHWFMLFGESELMFRAKCEITFDDDNGDDDGFVEREGKVRGTRWD